MMGIKILVIGATGSIGSLVVKEALRKGHAVRALVRSAEKASQLPTEAQVTIGDITRPETLVDATDGVDAIVFAHGSNGASKVGSEIVDYGGVRNVLMTIKSRPVRIALMTAIGVTNRAGSYNQSNESHDWKRRAERLVRHSGLPYTIVRPGWFDYNKADEHHLVFLQGDTRHAGNSGDGVIARGQIAQVLIHSLTSDQASRKTFELVAIKGPAQADLDGLFEALDADAGNALDGIRDAPNQPIDDEPQRVKDDLRVVSNKAQLNAFLP